MWLATKQAARKPKPLGPVSHDTLVKAHGLTPAEATDYLTLAKKHPQVELGPDQDVLKHWAQLRRAEATRPPRRSIMDAIPLAADRGAEQPAEWQRQLPSDLAQRAHPGWFTGQSVMPAPDGYGDPGPVPLPNRTPGTHYVNPALQARPPAPQQTREEWLRGLADKGIFVNWDNRRMTPEELQLPQRHPSGRQMLDEFAYRQRAAARAYVAKVLKLAEAGDADDPNMQYPAYAAWFKRHKMMGANGWDFTESGGGNHYHKEINGKHHFIVGEPDGWTHYVSSSPYGYAGSWGNGPYEHIGEAMINAERGPFRNMVVNPSTKPDNAFVDVRKSGPFGDYEPADVSMRKMNGAA